MNQEVSISLFRQMVRQRKFEDKLLELFSTRVMPGSMHQYNGQEAVAAGICAHLSRDDYVSSTHRGHGHCIAKGADVNAVMAEMFAKSTGCCRGMGGSMHIADFGVGMLGANGIVAGGIPLAVGAAWSCKHLSTNHVVVSFFGDGAVNEGAFHEAMNLAATWQLPVLFACENNLYGFSTHYSRTVNIENLADRAQAYGMPGAVIDGMNVRAVYAAAEEAIGRARRGEGPTLLEFKTYRFRGHSRFEDASYRTKDELNEWLKRDPIPTFRMYLQEKLGVDAEDLDRIETEAEQEMDSAVEFAEAGPDPQPEDYQQYIYA